MTNAWHLMALNNAASNATLLAACAALTEEEFAASRTSFFPSLRETLNHILWVDAFYIDALTGGGIGHRIWDDEPDHATAATLAPAQAAMDARLTAFCATVTPQALAAPLGLDRDPKGIVTERVDLTLLHLFQHQIHHRGQAHAMLAGTRVPPPQLDEFFLPSDRHPLNPEARP
jgi:uncharacterized damage-inducible protein DinB